LGIGEKASTVNCNCIGSAFMVQPSAEQLTILANLIDDGAVKLPKVTIVRLLSSTLARHMS
jgi:hypothetical protein